MERSWTRFSKIALMICIGVATVLFAFGTYLLGSIENKSTEKTVAVKEGFSIQKAFNMDDFTVDQDPFNVLIMGYSGGNTDTMMVANFAPRTSKLTFLSIPRDTRIFSTRSFCKINSIYCANGEGDTGAKADIKVLKGLLGIDIKYYVVVDTAAFRYIIDALGGIYINVPTDLRYRDVDQKLDINIKRGYQKLDGKAAEGYVRFRHPAEKKNGSFVQLAKDFDKYYDNSDLTRINVQQVFLKELIKQKANAYSIAKLNELIDIMFKYVKTDIKLQDIIRMSGNISKINISTTKMFKLGVADAQDGSWDVIFNDSLIDNTAKTVGDKNNATPIAAGPILSNCFGVKKYVFNNMQKGGTQVTKNGNKTAIPFNNTKTKTQQPGTKKTGVVKQTQVQQKNVKSQPVVKPNTVNSTNLRNTTTSNTINNN